MEFAEFTHLLTAMRIDYTVSKNERLMVVTIDTKTAKDGDQIMLDFIFDDDGKFISMEVWW